MADIYAIRPKRSYLTSSLIDRLTSSEHPVKEMAPDMKELSKIDYQNCAIMVFVDQDLLQEQQALIFLRDKAVENELPIFLLGVPSDLDEAKEFIPTSVIQGEYVRPFDVNVIAEQITDFLTNMGSGANKKKILVVDDSGMMLRNVKKLLGEKYQIILANSGAMAIKYLTLDKPDLMLLDYEMPVVNGKQVLEIIRTEHDFSGVPVFFLTSKADKETIMDVMSLKPEGYLLKSLSAEDFVKSIDDFFLKSKKL